MNHIQIRIEVESANSDSKKQKRSEAINTKMEDQQRRAVAISYY